MLYAGLVLFAAALDRVLRVATGNEAWVLVSPQNTLAVVTDAIFGTVSDSAVPVAAALFVLGALMAVSVLILERRVRAVDVVA